MTHALDRIRERLTDDEAVLATFVIRRLETEMSKRYADKSYAVRILRLTAQRHTPWGEVSNGDEVWAVVRGGSVRTVMLRRSTQPATPEAMRVDAVLLLV